MDSSKTTSYKIRWKCIDEWLCEWSIDKKHGFENSADILKTFAISAGCVFLYLERKINFYKQNKIDRLPILVCTLSLSLSLSLKTDWCQIYTSNTRNPAGNQFLKFSHRNTRIKFEISPKLTIKTAEKRQWLQNQSILCRNCWPEHSKKLAAQDICLPMAIIANISWATMETTENQRTAFLHFINSKAVSAYTCPSSVRKKSNFNKMIIKYYDKMRL